MVPETNMDKIVKSHNILFVCIDSLRFDVASEEEANGGTPVLNRYGRWRKCSAPGNFTYPSHQAMFAGFLPVDCEINEMKKRETLFFSEDIGMGRKAPEGAFLFSRPTWIEELADIGYETYCIGGLSFFDKRTALGKVLPSVFQHSYWNPSFSCKVKDSAKNQVDFALKKISEYSISKGNTDSRIMMYINISALHYPNYFYANCNANCNTDCIANCGERDSKESHRMALRYVDSQLSRLFDGFADIGDTFVICCSDHGTCYGEDGVWYHGINHPIVNTVPYKHFIIEKNKKDKNNMPESTDIKNIPGDKTGHNGNIEEPYIQYMYSYPHKTAYRTLSGINLADRLNVLKGQANSLYFHIPFCQYKCGYCNLFSVAGAENKLSFMEEYVYTMERQAEQIAGVLPEGVSFNSMSLGGGTPLLLPLHVLRHVFVIAEKYFSIKYGTIPVNIETSPNQTDKARLDMLKENNVTRISIGVQSFNKIELRTLHRFHSPERAVKALELIRETGFPCLNIDIIYGIPGQTENTLLKSLKQALLFKPEEMFVYPLYVKSGTYLGQRGIKPSPDTMELYKCARDFLLSNGYIQQSMRRFVLKKYMPPQENNASLCGLGNTISIGCGGRSYIGNLHFCTPYTLGNAECIKQLNNYIKQEDFLEIKHGFILSEDEGKRRYAVKHILFGKGILKEDYTKHFNSRAEEDFPFIKEWCKKGYSCIGNEFISLTEEGTALSDYLGAFFISGEVKSKMEEWGQCH
ncbi:MAG: STM4012 family radical SAM protein [Lachnospiraceae bacterium]|nr:STM4012 family radical SAM protein [Lachnospiraceae bacterium]